jgi:hypothetical protein
MYFGTLVDDYYFCMIQRTDMEHIKFENVRYTKDNHIRYNDIQLSIHDRTRLANTHRC